MTRRPIAIVLLFCVAPLIHAQKYTSPDRKVRVALVKQPFSLTGTKQQYVASKEERVVGS